MPSQVTLRIAKSGAAAAARRRHAQQLGGAMKETAGWSKAGRPV
jgi:hypothetical protein